MQDRLAQLESQVEHLSQAVNRLESEMASLRASRAAAPAPAPLAPPAEGEVRLPSSSAVASFVPLVGRSFLVLGGAFLVRALAAGEVLPKGVCVAIGLAYAALWVALMDRDARRLRRASAELHGITATVIAFPLLWESATRFDALSPTKAAFAIAVAGAVLLGGGGVHKLRVTNWAVTALSAGTLALLIGATDARAALALAILVFGAATLVLAEVAGTGPRWPVAFLADFAVARAVALTMQQDAVPQGARTGAVLVCAALGLLYVGALGARTVFVKRAAGPFEAVQTPIALAIGIWGAAQVAQGAGGLAAVGGAALALALGAFAVAFAVDRREAKGTEFLLHASLALGLTLAGTALIAWSGPIGIVWAALGVAAIALGQRMHRRTMWAHAAILSWAAAFQSGLLGFLSDAYVGPPEESWRALGLASGLVLAIAVASALLMLGARDQRHTWITRAARAAVLSLVLLGAGALVLAGLRLAAPSLLADPGALAAFRTAVVALAALAQGSGRKLLALPELGVLAYTTLLFGGVKLLVEDLPRGRAATLFPAFALYGLALIFVPRMVRSEGKAAAAVTPLPSPEAKPEPPAAKSGS